jgi:UDP-glucose 4-epimerase
MMNVLVTGHKGYIGQHLCKMIRQSRPEINLFGLDKCGTAEDRQDICQRFYSDVVYNTVIHLAARVRVGESVNKPTLYYDTNINGTLNILENANYHNFIFASTGVASNPGSPYGYSKRVAEDIVAEKCYDYTIFRFYNVIGSDGFAPTNPDGLMYNLMKAKEKGEFTIFGTDINSYDGTCVRDYVHVTDVAKAHITGLEYLMSGGQSVLMNLGTGKGHSNLEIINLIKDKLNLPVKYTVVSRRQGDPDSLVADINLAQKVLQFKPRYDIMDILQTAYDWHLKNDK